MSDGLGKVAVLALEIAAGAPLEGKAASCQIPWRLIRELRDELDAAGVDWRTYRRDVLCHACAGAMFWGHGSRCPRRQEGAQL